MDYESHIAKHIQTLPRSGIRDFFELVQQSDDVISLGVGEPDFHAPWSIREAVINALEKGHTHYTSNLGSPTLRKAISEYVLKNYKISYAPDDEVLVTVGVSEGLDLALRALINSGDEVIYHEPSYVSYSPSIIISKGVPVAIPTKFREGFTLKPKQLEVAITSKSKVLILNFPTNPTGATLSKSDIEDLAEICIKNDLIVLTDEIYSELVYEETHCSIASIPGMQERTLFLHGFSKAFAMTGFRLGYACGPAPLIEAMMKIHQYTMLCAPSMSQVGAVEALKNCSLAVMDMKENYRLRRNYLLGRVQKMGLECCFPKGSFYLFLSINQFGLSSHNFATQLLEQEKIAVVPGSAFGESGEGFVRCCYATTFELLEQAMDGLQKFVNRLRAQA